MSTSIPYDPEEFDNNPFSEPVTRNISSQHLDDAKQHGEQQHQQQEQQQRQYIEQEQPALPKSVESQQIKDIDEERNLIPERFDDKDHWKIEIIVQAIERYGSFQNKRDNPNIIFEVSTNIPLFKHKEYKTIKKSYGEFQSFFKFLNVSITECFIYSLPHPSTSYGIANELDYQQTIANFQNWLSKIVSNPILTRLEELQYFIESDFNSYQPVTKLNHPATGIKRKTLKQLQPPYDECLELAEFRPLVKSIYQNSQLILESLEKLVKFKKSLSANEGELGSKLQELKELETNHVGMQQMWLKLGKTIQTVGDLNSIIASLELATLGDGLDEVVRDTYIFKESLTDRHLLMRELIAAQQNSKLKHENARKLQNKRDINPIKVNEAIRSLEDAIKEEEELTKRLKRITKEMLIEKNQIIEEYSRFISRKFKEFILTKIEYERKKLMVLEKFRVDVRAVDAKGGLSRLGRENYPKHQGSAHLSSQGPNGDNWNGDRKKSHFGNVNIEAVEKFHDKKKDNVKSNDFVDGHEENKDDMPIDARNAASLLGVSTFN
ncbi:hypothetical protein WICMUC_004819 [Wickerhamomyces mucosus]|uniref:Vacuolar protein sorting-associated protein 17 n=1 Tax=Wickerhamomyces mucosus TaxID=1378264 RepID=A0A9P8TA08_9ASCO|nr:hypothetical protein WICMUC_004819 [Wickerhamomyces mucosus]